MKKRVDNLNPLVYNKDTKKEREETAMTVKIEIIWKDGTVEVANLTAKALAAIMENTEVKEWRPL